MNLQAWEKGSNKKRQWQPLCVWHLLVPSATTSTCNAAPAVTICCQERSGYKNALNRAAVQEQQKSGLAPAPGALVRPPRMGCSSACNLTLGKSSRGADSCGFGHGVVKHGTGPSAGRNKACWGKEKSQPKATVLDSRGCAMLTHSDMVTYLNLYPRSVQIPAKEEETLG